ncbi:MAG TPA: LysM peptidoglycan-binding domain-containing protein [Candidatus Dormibacteraeota bacterium]|jgi:nucleoid-associated protein YgaU
MVSSEQMYVTTSPVPRAYRARRPRSPWPARVRNGAVLLGALLAMALGFAKVAEGGAVGSYETLRVEPGDTLWAIAAQRYPGTDVRSKVWQIEQANHLSNHVLKAGQALRVPTR